MIQYDISIDIQNTTKLQKYLSKIIETEGKQ